MFLRMELKNFLKVATKRERADVAVACGDSVSYLYQIAGQHRYASPLMATQIERYTRIVADMSDGRLAPVPRASMVRHPEIFYGVDPTPDAQETGGDNERT
ncbi:MAG: hypothetical protein GYB33_08130 [Gammaproteobacteria bacterium]|nr:hypothetical protein [Gammaproteobacteria bacterium]